MSVMKCARQVRHFVHSVDVLVGVHVVKRHAIVDVLCRPVVNVVIGVHIVMLSVPLVVVHVVPIFLAVILCRFIPLFSRSHFSHMFSLYSHGILGVVFTLHVGYSRPPSAVHDPTVTKQMNSGKSCLEEVSQLLIYQVALINQYWVRLHGDFRRNKESTMILASSTKTKNSLVSIVGFVELLLFLSIAAR